MAYGPTWILFAFFSILNFIFSIILVRYYADKHESGKLTKIVTVFTLFVPILIICIIPLDIYSLRLVTNYPSLKAGYYVIFSFILIISFIVIPFAYFFFEAEDEDTTTKKKIFSAFRYTAFTFIIVLILLLVGLLVSPGSVPEKGAKNWTKAMFGSDSADDSMILFPIGCLTLLGCYLFIFYTAYGMGTMPIALLKKKNTEDHIIDIQNELNEIRDQKMAIESREMLTGNQLTKKELTEIESLKKKERILSVETTRYSDVEQGRFEKCSSCLKMCSRFFGLIFLLVSLFLLVAFMASLIERVFKSECGWRCGFILKEPSLNPFDLFLTSLAKGFPMDFFFLFLFATYILMTTLVGIIKISVRFLWIKMYRIRKQASPDQGLLLTGLFIMMVSLVMVFQFMNIAPQYMTFGIGKNVDGMPCSLSDVGVDPNKCKMSMISKLAGRITVKMSFFAIVYYIFDWIFVILLCIFIIVAMKKKVKNTFDGHNSDLESDDGL
ncbi:lysosomal cobalamin transporter-related [Anaeramoeba flamelloides]|uniref:Lysosomal cobalamin transporter-related n=1 Tax=Anaeramoeba flamelloides TaxID=1746091 RepID=A0AAV7YSR4_9EUKA|nr:lysosomal cobalamin transporter-related [Anaeramoeba flamelloides]